MDLLKRYHTVGVAGNAEGVVADHENRFFGGFGTRNPLTLVSLQDLSVNSERGGWGLRADRREVEFRMRPGIVNLGVRVDQHVTSICLVSQKPVLLLQDLLVFLRKGVA